MTGIIFTMTTSGSIAYILAKLFCILFSRKLSIQSQRRFYLISLTFFLAPFCLLKHFFVGLCYRVHFPIEQIFPWLLANESIDYRFLTVQSRGQILYSTRFMMLIHILMCCIILITLFIFLYRGIAYVKFRKQLRNIFSLDGRKFSYISSDRCTVPFTTDFLHPVIIVPGFKENEQDQKKYILLHEIMHIRHHDFMIHLLSLTAITVNWFNPFVYALFMDLHLMNEIYADDAVCCDFTIAEKKKYCYTLLLYTAKEQNPIKNVLYCSDEYRYLKKRILYLSQDKKTARFYHSGLCTILLISICILNVFTYIPNTTILTTKEEFTDNMLDNQWIQNTDYSDREKLQKHATEPVRFIRYHREVGGNTIYYYTGERCKICGEISNIQLSEIDERQER